MRLKNHIARLLAIALDFVNVAFKKSRMSNSAMAALFTANITEARQAMASASECSAQVCHKLLLWLGWPYLRTKAQGGPWYKWACFNFLPSFGGAFYTKSARRPRQVPGQFHNRLEVIHKNVSG